MPGKGAFSAYVWMTAYTRRSEDTLGCLLQLPYHILYFKLHSTYKYAILHDLLQLQIRTGCPQQPNTSR